MSTYPQSPNETMRGMMYFPRMLDKIRLHAGGELHEDYHYRAVLTKRFWSGVSKKAGDSNEGDIVAWNGFTSKLGWRDFATPTLERLKKEHGISDRSDIVTIPDLINFDEGRFQKKRQNS
jgi:hypothetical protein